MYYKPPNHKMIGLLAKLAKQEERGLSTKALESIIKYCLDKHKKLGGEINVYPNPALEYLTGMHYGLQVILDIVAAEVENDKKLRRKEQRRQKKMLDSF